MITFVAANSNPLLHFLAGQHPLKLGWIVSPACGFRRPFKWLPYVIDNGKYSSFVNSEQWNEDAFFDLLDRYKFQSFGPDWIVAPDEIGKREETIDHWHSYETRLRRYGWRVAFVAQDGMTPNDVPESADLVFIGGTTKWKWRNVALFCATFPRVHVGRVNWHDKLEYCERVGAESCDGSGFFRMGDGERVQHLIDFISGHRRHAEQPQLFGT